MTSKLIKACCENDITKLKTLLKSQKHVETINDLYSWHYKDSIPFPVLSYACQNKSHDFVKVLLDNGASDDIEDTDGFFPIHYACGSEIDSLAKVKMLVERNADNVNKRGKSDATSLMYVRCNDTLEYLIQKGARVDDVNEDGCSALHYASDYNRPIIINALLNHGVDVNQRSYYGDTPLHLGAQQANLDVIKALVTSPSYDIHPKNAHGQSALDIARSRPEKNLDYHPVIKYLENVVMNPVALLGTRLNSMEISCDVLKYAKNRMNESQCRQCDELAKRVLDLEKQMQHVFNDKKKGEALSKRDRELIQQLQDENRKLNEQIRQLTLAVENITITTVAGPPETKPTQNEYDAKLLGKAVRSCFYRLLDDIHWDQHAPFLFSKRALSRNEYEIITAKDGSRSKLETMLNFLIDKKNPAWAPLFLESLKNSGTCTSSVKYIEDECRRPSLAAEKTIV